LENVVDTVSVALPATVQKEGEVVYEPPLDLLDEDE
jgi:hypothetical protein